MKKLFVILVSLFTMTASASPADNLKVFNDVAVQMGSCQAIYVTTLVVVSNAIATSALFGKTENDDVVKDMIGMTNIMKSNQLVFNTYFEEVLVPEAEAAGLNATVLRNLRLTTYSKQGAQLIAFMVDKSSQQPNKSTFVLNLMNNVTSCSNWFKEINKFKKL